MSEYICPSCHGLNISCPDGCGRDPRTGELNGTRLTDPNQIAIALAERDKKASTCPADKRHLGDKDCPKCGSSSAGPCWIKHNADGAFVEAVRAIIERDSNGT